MFSSTQSSTPSEIVVDIPPELLLPGKTLLIEKYSELFVDGYHLRQPSRFVRQVHGLCLLDTQEQDLRSVDHKHQLQSTIDDNQLVQINIEFRPELLHNGVSVTVEKNDGCVDQAVAGNVNDLYNGSDHGKTVHVRLGQQCLERGTTIHIDEKKISVGKSEGPTHHLLNNQFTKRDHLQAKHLMEMTIEVPPEFFEHICAITFRKEDEQTATANFAYHRHSRTSLDDFLSNKTWHPTLADNGRALLLTLDLTAHPLVETRSQVTISHHGCVLRVQLHDQPSSPVVQHEVLLPETVHFDRLEYQLEKQPHRLQIILPLH